jgi:ferredoxin
VNAGRALAKHWDREKPANEQQQNKVGHLPGVIIPIVDFKRCEGTGHCLRVCPESVFQIRRIDGADYRNLNPLQKFKLRVLGMKVAYTPNADACRACGLCSSACPEDAITLRRAGMRL